MSAGSLGRLTGHERGDERRPSKAAANPDRLTGEGNETVRRFIREMAELRKRWVQEDEATDLLARQTFGARIGRR